MCFFNGLAHYYGFTKMYIDKRTWRFTFRPGYCVSHWLYRLTAICGSSAEVKGIHTHRECTFSTIVIFDLCVLCESRPEGAHRGTRRDQPLLSGHTEFPLGWALHKIIKKCTTTTALHVGQTNPITTVYHIASAKKWLRCQENAFRIIMRHFFAD